MTTQDLMEVSDETLILWASMVKDEVERRHIGVQVVELHPGQVERGKPIPVVVRVLTKIAKLKPQDVAKVEVLIDGLSKPLDSSPA